jgi:outer membrane immunogenic protein
VYGKAGWVWGNFEFASAFASGCPTCTNFTEGVAATKTLNGLLLGVGVEHAFTQNWTVKLEYNFLDFGSGGANFAQCETFITSSCSTVLTTTSEHAYKHIFKVGFNYLFNPWGAPLVARY